jgi:hypothetical protein
VKNLPDIVKGLKVKPAYLLVLGLAIVVVVPALVRLEGALLVVVVLGTLLLALVPIWIDSRSVTVPDPGERGEITKIKDSREAIRSVFGDLVDESLDTYIVYPSHPIVELQDEDGNPITWKFTEREKRVTTIVGAHAIARLQALLQLGGKSKRLRHVTSAEFHDDWWGSGLVLVGGPLSNKVTKVALEEFECPFRFSKDMAHIVQVGAKAKWPRSGEGDLDYGIVANLKRVQAGAVQTCLIVAGLGALSALAGAVFLERELDALYESFGDRPFACLVSVNKDVGPRSVEAVKSVGANLIEG